MTHFKHSVTQVEECRVAVSDCLLYLHNILNTPIYGTPHLTVWQFSVDAKISEIFTLWSLFPCIYLNSRLYNLEPLNMDEMRISIPEIASKKPELLPLCDAGFQVRPKNCIKHVSNNLFLYTIIKIILCLTVFFSLNPVKTTGRI